MSQRQVQSHRPAPITGRPSHPAFPFHSLQKLTIFTIIISQTLSSKRNIGQLKRENHEYEIRTQTAPNLPVGSRSGTSKSAIRWQLTGTTKRASLLALLTVHLPTELTPVTVAGPRELPDGLVLARQMKGGRDKAIVD